jgi:hypothetical protein
VKIGWWSPKKPCNDFPIVAGLFFIMYWSKKNERVRGTIAVYHGACHSGLAS